MSSLPDRFWAKVDKNGPEGFHFETKVPLGPCWVWNGARVSKGYGSIKMGKRATAAHRLAFIDVHGGIPDGLHLDHLCRNRTCVNPKHLEPVTSGVNTRRGFDARKRKAA